MRSALQADRADDRSAARAGEISIEPVADLESLREEWSQLAESSGNVFATWEWAFAWWREFGAGKSLRITACRRADGSLVGILPLHRVRLGPLRCLRFVGHGPADQLGPICAPADRPAVARALERRLASESERSDLFVADRLARAEGWSARLGGTHVRTEASPVLRLDGRSWEDLLRARSANFRQQVRRRERNLVRGHRLRFRLVEDGRRLEDDLDRLFTLHDQRWSGRSSAFSAPRRAFHLSFARLALERGWLRLWTAETNGTAVAAWYGFRFGGCDWYYQAGRDPAWEQAAVGFVLLAHTVREAATDGMREYRLLLGDEPYKARFATDDDPVETLALSHGSLGRAAVALARSGRRLPPQARRLVAGLAEPEVRR